MIVAASSDTGNVYAYGGGLYAGGINNLTGEVSGNSANASSTQRDAEAYGGGVHANILTTLKVK